MVIQNCNQMAIASDRTDHVRRPWDPLLTAAFGPISAHLGEVQECLVVRLRNVAVPAVREVVELLLGVPGKRIRPALVLLSAGAASGTPAGHSKDRARVKLAVAVELIHMASLVHDDLIDGAEVRHNRPTVGKMWGKNVAVRLGDHLCGQAVRLVAECGDPRLFSLIGSGLCAMCEGEMLQVMGRTGEHLSERRCLEVIEKKTARLFAACCEVGAVAAEGQPTVRTALTTFGLHFGVAFQLLDDCRDVLSDQNRLGKRPAQDWLAGDATLPLLHVATHAPRCAIHKAPRGGETVAGQELDEIRKAFLASNGDGIMGKLVASHVGQAREQLALIPPSNFRLSLGQLADYIAEAMSDLLAK